jgi:mono/diheme cytochrome c family protein
LHLPGLLLAAAAAGLLANGLPELRHATVDAYPTSLYRSATRFSARAIAEGGQIYRAHCAGCHGAHGHGDGADGRGLAVRPADLTAPHVLAHADGELFWWVGQGIAAPDGTPAMPGFAGALDDWQIWATIDYARALAHGASVPATHGWMSAAAAPDMPLVCAGRARTLAGLNGRIVRLVFGLPPTGLTDDRAVVTVTQTPGGPEGCSMAEPALARAAYAVVSGRDVAAMDGISIWIDAVGRLRELSSASDPDSETTATRRARLLADDFAPPPPPLCVTRPEHLAGP